MQHNRDIGVLTDDALVILGLPRTRTCYRRPDPTSMQLVEVPRAEAEADLRWRELADHTESAFAFAYNLYVEGRWRLPEPVPKR